MFGRELDKEFMIRVQGWEEGKVMVWGGACFCVVSRDYKDDKHRWNWLLTNTPTFMYIALYPY